MKHGDLRSIGHNIADSLSSGIGLMIGVYDLDVFAEARHSATGCIVVDFLAGEIIEGQASDKLADCVSRYRQQLPALCERHGISIAAFCELSARYGVDRAGTHFTVTVVDESGHRSVTEYEGIPGKRAKHRDSLGRVRKKPVA